jgi:beta-glucosidase
MTNNHIPALAKYRPLWVLCMIQGLFFFTPAIAADQSGADKAAPQPGASAMDEVVFAANEKTPWRFYLGSMNNWMVPVEGPETRSYKSKVVTIRTIDNVGRADAYQAEWKGGLGQVYWQESNPRDYRKLAAAGGALSMEIRIDKKPKKKVEVKMDCGYPCAGTLNMTQIFKAVPEGQWFRMSLAVSCFEESGANLSNIVSPLVVATSGDFEMSFADVRLLTNPPPESLIPCK